MFQSLNRFISRLDADPLPQTPSQQSYSSTDTSYGFQVLRNSNPDLHLEPWFDFIIGLNGHYIDSPDPHLFLTEIRNCAGAQCTFELWSAKGQRLHSLTAPIPSDPSSLGLSLQLAPLDSTQNIWHVLTIPSPLSPAHEAGLLPHSDYILGSPSGILRGEAALGELVEDHLNRSLTLWVYNSEFDVVREVELVPKRGWGGEGALGAVLGFGALHRLPVALGEEVQAPGENMFDAGVERKSIDTARAQAQGDFETQQPEAVLSPPPMISPAAPPPPMVNPNAAGPARGGARGKKRGQQPAGANLGFDDMFAEGQKKSAEQNPTSSKKAASLAPPPKTGAPASEKAESVADTNDEDLGEPGEAEVT